MLISASHAHQADFETTTEDVPIRPNLNLTDPLKELFVSVIDPVDKMLDVTLRRLDAVRDACKVAEQAVENRRSALRDALMSYVHAVQELEKQAIKMQEAVGEVLIREGNLGG